jgi:hypothetical protein
MPTSQMIPIVSGDWRIFASTSQAWRTVSPDGSSQHLHLNQIQAPHLRGSDPCSHSRCAEGGINTSTWAGQSNRAIVNLTLFRAQGQHAALNHALWLCGCSQGYVRGCRQSREPTGSNCPGKSHAMSRAVERYAGEGAYLQVETVMRWPMVDDRCSTNAVLPAWSASRKIEARLSWMRKKKAIEDGYQVSRCTHALALHDTTPYPQQMTR